jgi:quercetin dioxygenase-like cupin family protein
MNHNVRERSHPVEIQPKRASVKGPAAQFTGDVWLDAIAQGAEPSRLRVNHVHFAPGARTAWHSHPRGQTLYVTDGRGRVQSRGGEINEIRPGEVIYTPPSEWHWHGAAPTHFMAHLSLVEADDHGNSATWGEHVSDAEYGAEPSNKT